MSEYTDRKKALYLEARKAQIESIDKDVEHLFSLTSDSSDIKEAILRYESRELKKFASEHPGLCESSGDKYYVISQGLCGPFLLEFVKLTSGGTIICHDYSSGEDEPCGPLGCNRTLPFESLALLDFLREQATED